MSDSEGTLLLALSKDGGKAGWHVNVAKPQGDKLGGSQSSVKQSQHGGIVPRADGHLRSHDAKSF